MTDAKRESTILEHAKAAADELAIIEDPTARLQARLDLMEHIGQSMSADPHIFPCSTDEIPSDGNQEDQESPYDSLTLTLRQGE